ncbi:MAG: hypothetical protein LBG79_05740 [Spirochaetaceae bacterium]|jgi:hypothetical protein|nr:hypothetical protein [Spirochaetaceae bacterium]
MNACLKTLFFGLIMAAFSPALSGWECGLLFSNEFRFENTVAAIDNPNEIYESGRISSWFSFRPAPMTSIYLKAGVSAINEAVLSNIENWKIAPELDSARLTIFPDPAFFAELGRIPFSDIISLSANGMFDGAKLRFSAGEHGISASAFYTGLLYKETAKIFLNAQDKDDYYRQNYFAPPHLLMSLAYHFKPESLEGSRFSAEFIREADMRKGSTSSTMFFLAGAALVLKENITMDAGGLLSAGVESDESTIGLAALFSLRVHLNQPLKAELSFNTNLFWGALDEPLPLPFINKRQVGLIYDPEVARLLNLQLIYTAILTPTLSFNTSLMLFARLDSDYMPDFWQYIDYQNENANGFLLGEEFYAGVIWTPLSDLSFNISAIFFFPDNGPDSVYIRNTPMKWDLRLGLLISM